MLKQRVITAVILAAFFFAALFGLSPFYFAGLCLVALMAAAYEWGGLTGLGTGGSLAVAGGVLLTGLVLLFGTGFSANRGFPDLSVLVVCGAASAFWIVAAPLWLRFGWTTRRPVTMTALGALVVLALWMAMVQLQARTPWLLLATMMIVWIADTAAYFAGRKFGRRKLAPIISPGKSWEGVYGALVCVFIYAALLLLFSPLAAHAELSRPLIVVFGLVLAAVSVVGDLFESWMKRQAGVKDSGTALPGHGGVLDRIDALLPALPLATLFLVLMSY
jgi:phosphatidate cytidylyltransferase